MSDPYQTMKPEYEPSSTTQSDPTVYMADIDYEKGPAKQSLYQRITNSQRFQMLCRAFQCIASIVAFILFAYRFYRIAHTANRATTASNDAILGILVGAVLYDIGSIIGKHVLKNGGPNYLRFVWVTADVAFVVAFIMVAELTSPGRGMTSGPCRTIRGINLQEFGINCTLPTGTFVSAIVNTILHAVTAVFNPIYGQYRNRKNRLSSGAAMMNSELQA